MKVKKKSQLQEKSVAKDLDAKTVIASGALWGSKGDVRHEDFLVECKTTEKSSYSLTMKVWEKIEKEAIKDGLRTPLMCVDTENGKYRFAVFREKDFRHYKTYYDLPMGDNCCCVNKSFLVFAPCRVLMTSYTDKRGEIPVFVVAPWDDFLYMLKGGVK